MQVVGSSLQCVETECVCGVWECGACPSIHHHRAGNGEGKAMQVGPVGGSESGRER